MTHSHRSSVEATSLKSFSGLFPKGQLEIIKLQKGDCLIFCGQTKHGGNKVTMGTRYIVSGFLKYGVFDYDKYYNND